MPKEERGWRREDRDSRSIRLPEPRLQAEDGGEPWSVHDQLLRQVIGENRYQMDEAYPANTPHALSVGDDREDSISNDVAEGVWGYLLPLNSQQGTPIALKNASTSPIAKTEGSYETGNLHNADKHPVSSAGRYLIGRHSECDLHVEDPLVSNRHCLIFTENKDGRTIVIIEDLSSNGTFVNEAIVGRNKRRELKDRDEIIILDKARFIFRYPKTITEGKIFSQKYSIRQKIGKGHFSEVFSCVEKSTGHVYAVKVFTKSPGDLPSKIDSLQQEIAIFMGIDHPNILYAKDTFDEQDAVYLVLELAPEGELFNLIVEKQKLSEEETRKIFLQIFQAVKYLHDRNIVYRDIKPENILLVDKEDLTIKLMDFGLTKIIGVESFTTTLCGTPSYVAPEILADSRHRRYTRAVDIWSLGVVLYICLCGFPPFSDELYTKENPFTLTDQIKAGRFDYPSPYWDSVGDPALDLIDRMLTVDAEKRYTIDECLEHPWMQNKTASSSSTLTTDNDLFGGISSLNFSKRKVVRERTLLSNINDVKITRVIEVGPHMDPVKVNDKNTNSEATISQPGNKRTFAPADYQFEPPAKLLRAFADLGPQRSSSMPSSSSNFPGLSLDRDKTGDGPEHHRRKVREAAAQRADEILTRYVSNRKATNAEEGRGRSRTRSVSSRRGVDDYDTMDWGVFDGEESPPSYSSAAKLKKLQAVDPVPNNEVAQEEQSKDSMIVEQSSLGPQSLSLNPENILPSESSELISTPGYQANSLLDSSDEASASTEATDVSNLDFTVTYSDDENDDSPLEEYDLGGRSLERRLIDPEGYFQDLRDLEKEVITNSGLKLLIESKPSVLKDPHAELSKPIAEVSNQVLALFNTEMIEQNRAISKRLLWCRKMMECCCSNIDRLQKAGFCGEYITVIAEDRYRSTVAKLHKVSTKIIFNLLHNFRKVHAETRPPGVDVNLYRQIVVLCVEILTLMGMSPPGTFEYVPESTFLFFTEEDDFMLATLQATVEALDLAVVSYSGTHIRNFHQSDTYSGNGVFMLPGIYSEDEELKALPVIFLRRRRLRCMDAFLGDREVWVFQEESIILRNGPLWLSTGIEELNDLWGPCWKLIRDKELGEIQSIEIGNGCILPWSGPKREDNLWTFPLIDGNEVYSHWISSKDWDDAVAQRGQQGLERKYFTEDSTFLIGASPYTGLAVNPSCKPSKADLVWKKTRLEEKNALRIPKTSYARRFKDSHSYQITANIPIAGSHTQALSYKRQDGLDRKSGLVERWRNNSGNPGELEDFSGVEVSICTQNACRMRLLSILGSDTMRDYLHGISFSWPTKRFETDYFEAMKSRRKFRKFWNRHLSFSNKISSAISICLDILQTTGVNHDNGELGALWVAEFEDDKYQDYSDDDDDSEDDMSDARSDSASRDSSFTGPVETRMPFKKVEEVIVTLFRSEYSWTGFLRDSPETITMAIVTSSCLEATDDRALGRRCKRGWWEDGKYITVRGFPVIQTSLFVNEAILESSQLVSERVPGRSRGYPSCRVWNTDGLQESSRFSLGDHGTLEVTVLPTKCCPVTIMAWADVKSSTWNEMKEVGFNEQLLGRSREPHHKEHVSGVWETQPLPVLIMSKSKKETFL